MQQDGKILLSRAALDLLFLHIFRSNKVFQVALSYLKPTHFNKIDEIHYAAIWSSYIDYYKKYNSKPSKQLLLPFIVGNLKTHAAIDSSVENNARSLLDWIFDYENNPDSCLSDPCALTILKHFLYDREVGNLLEKAVETRKFGGLVKFPSLIDDINDINLKFQSISNLDIPQVAVNVWGSPASKYIPTGISFIDSLLDGGVKNGDVNIILGPTGVAKTLLGVQLATEYAKRQYAIENNNGKGKLSLIFSYEDDLQSIRIRIMSCAARIHRYRLETLFNLDQLSTTGNLQPYESQFYDQQGIYDQKLRLGEKERYSAAAVWVNEFMRVVDFSGSTVTSVGGSGGIPEIAGTIDMICDMCNRQVGLVIIDWAGMSVRRYLRLEGRIDRLSIELIDYVDNVSKQIANKYNCPVWVLHQLRGQANKKPPTVVLDHTDAEWCSSFAVNATNALVLGTKDRETSTCLLAATKTRRGASKPPVLCYIDGAFGKLYVSDSYTFNNKKGIIEKLNLAPVISKMNDDVLLC